MGRIFNQQVYGAIFFAIVGLGTAGVHANPYDQHNASGMCRGSADAYEHVLLTCANRIFEDPLQQTRCVNDGLALAYVAHNVMTTTHEDQAHTFNEWLSLCSGSW